MKDKIVWMRIPFGSNFNGSKLISAVNDQITKDLQAQGQTLKNPPAIKPDDEPSQKNPINAFYYELDLEAKHGLEKWLKDAAGLTVRFDASQENVVDREGFPMVGMSKEEFWKLSDYIKGKYAQEFAKFAEGMRYKIIERVVLEGDRDPLDGISAKEAGTLIAFLDTKLSPTFQAEFNPCSDDVVKEIAKGVCEIIKQDFPGLL